MGKVTQKRPKLFISVNKEGREASQPTPALPSVARGLYFHCYGHDDGISGNPRSSRTHTILLVVCPGRELDI